MPEQHAKGLPASHMETTGNPEVGSRLKAARLASGLTQKDVLERLGRPREHNSWLSNKETGKRALNQDELAAFANLYGISVDSLLGIGSSGPENILERLGSISESLVAVPVYGMEAHAGFASGSIHDYVYSNPPPTAVSRRLAALRVRGDCLVPDVMDGYLIVVDGERTAQPGDIIVISDGEEVNVCRLAVRNGKPVATNNDGTLDLEQVTIEGVVIQISRDL